MLMIFVRLAKVLMTAALAAFALLVAWNNVVDYNSNYEFVRHVLSMDTTVPGNALMGRAITGETAWRVAYAVIIVAEFVTGFLLALGAVVLLLALRAPAERFNRAKATMVAGATLGFGLWFFGFMVVAGEYFAMWQSHEWNGQEGAFRFYMAILGVLIFVSLRDDELA
jgi:predicted small integral membrane protein